MAGRLEGKVAIITGATSGIGEATARRFATEGASLLIAGRTVAKGEALARELGSHVVFEATDVTREEDLARLIDSAVTRFGHLDCMFNNAGAASPRKLEDITGQQIIDTLQLLLGSVILGTRHAARVMKERGGSIINNASVAAHRAGQGDLVYSSAKAAVSQFTHLAAVELGQHNIRVNAISPGAIATPIFWGGSSRANQLSDEENHRKLAKLEANLAKATPLPRTGQAMDIAHEALFLASDEGSFVNGHDLVVDGGRIWQFHERTAG